MFLAIISGNMENELNIEGKETGDDEYFETNIVLVLERTDVFEKNMSPSANIPSARDSPSLCKMGTRLSRTVPGSGIGNRHAEP